MVVTGVLLDDGQSPEVGDRRRACSATIGGASVVTTD